MSFRTSLHCRFGPALNVVSDRLLASPWPTRPAGCSTARALVIRGGQTGPMVDPADDDDLVELTAIAERLDELADTAELMGDVHGATRFRTAAWQRRDRAMRLLDD